MQVGRLKEEMLLALFMFAIRGAVYLGSLLGCCGRSKPRVRSQNIVVQCDPQTSEAGLNAAGC